MSCTFRKVIYYLLMRSMSKRNMWSMGKSAGCIMSESTRSAAWNSITDRPFSIVCSSDRRAELDRPEKPFCVRLHLVLYSSLLRVETPPTNYLLNHLPPLVSIFGFVKLNFQGWSTLVWPFSGAAPFWSFASFHWIKQENVIRNSLFATESWWLMSIM